MPLTAELLRDDRLLLGEGAIWHARTQRLYWIDIKGRSVFALETNGRSLQAPVPETVGTVVPTNAGTKLLVSLARRLAFLDFKDGRLAPFPVEPIEPAGNRFNDGKCDPAGRFWVGSMEDAEVNATGRLFRLGSDLVPHPILDGIGVSNGLVWSHDAKTMFYIDSPTQRVDAFDFDLETGAIANRRTVRQFQKGDGYPDGMTIDAEGFLWVAMWDGWGVHRLDPRSGKTVSTIQLPVARVTSCAFGGPRLDTLYVTSARWNLSPEQQISQPHAGSLFVAEPGVCGVEAVEFRI